MNNRRWFVSTLLLACILWLGTACTAEEIPLEAIGLRYTPAEEETCLTRDSMDATALSAMGVDQETLLDSMTRENLYLLSLFPDGRQLSLSVSEKPDRIESRNASEMTVAEKEIFLSELARGGDYGTATWKADGYALFASTAQAQADGSLSYADLTLATLYLDRVYAFHMDLIGREATQKDIDLLLSAETRALRLGACEKSEQTKTDPEPALTLPDVSVKSENAVLSYQSQDYPLTLNPIAATIGTTQFTLSGTTAPEGYLRYAVNGRSSSRVRADAQGAFSVLVPNLTGDAENQLEVTAFRGDTKTVVDFTVTVDWVSTPLILQPTDGVQGDEVTLLGLTLPGTTVALTRGRGTARIVVADDGTFQLTLKLPRVGDNAFTLQAQATGYRRSNVSFQVTRVLSEADTVQALLKQVKAADYAKLARNPDAYEGTVVRLSGVASALSYGDGSPRFTLTDASGAVYTVLCEDLLRVSEGAAVELLGTLGKAAETEDGSPTLTLGALLS